MDAREQRGLMIAATTKLWSTGGGNWTVPSQSGGGKYSVSVNGDCVRCTCPDFSERQQACKHVFAVRFTMQRELEFSTCVETNSRGETTVTETTTVRESVKVSYPQNWHAYNQAQTNEKALFLQLLHDLCAGIEEPVQTFGRPRLPLSDRVFSAVYKTYSTVSCRRFMTDLNDAHEKGWLGKVPCYNSIFNYFEAEELTPILQALIAQSALPLAGVESQFAIDSSGFGTDRFAKWHDIKHKGEKSLRDWVKAHICTGVNTNIVTSVEISHRHAADSPFLPALVAETAKSFTMKEVSADKGYTGSKSMEAITLAGAVPFIAFKENATGKHGSPTWKKMYHMFAFNSDAFFASYHKRSNVETTFSMVKRKFGDSLRSKTDRALVNETLCKFVAHNICVVIQAMYELGIDPGFCPKSAVAA